MRQVIRAAAAALTVALLAAGSTSTTFAGGHGTKSTKKTTKKTKGKSGTTKVVKGKKSRSAAKDLEASAKVIEAICKGTQKSDPALSGDLNKLKQRSNVNPSTAAPPLPGAPVQSPAAAPCGNQ